MDRYRCPACGARGYRGRRCAECLYEPFTEEIAHGNHYHAGEPLILGTRPQSRQPGQGCSSYAGRRTGRLPLGKVLVILIAVGIALFVPGGIVISILLLVALFGKKKK